jgi:uncharacterized protein YecE (DUF72 family)
MDYTFYEKFYSHITKGTFIGMSKATQEKFQFSTKVPETGTHVKRLDIKKGAMTSFEEFLDKISPLKTANKLGGTLFQLPPSFTVSDFKSIEQFLDRLPNADSYDYAAEFRHPYWGTEGPWEMLEHYNIATVMTDSPAKENLQYLSDVIVTADHSLVRFHGRNNYLYSEQELKPWVDKVSQIRKQTKHLRVYFNRPWLTHYNSRQLVIHYLRWKQMR